MTTQPPRHFARPPPRSSTTRGSSAYPTRGATLRRIRPRGAPARPLGRGARRARRRRRDLVPQLTGSLPWLARAGPARARPRLPRAARRRRSAPHAGRGAGAPRAPARARHARRAGRPTLARELAELDRAANGSGSSLTAAELRLLPLLATHLSFREIGERLFVSRNTIKTQAISVYRKLGVSTRSAAIARAEQLGLVEAGAAGGEFTPSG